MTKKYTPPGGWAAQRQRQILWFLAMFLFFGGVGWYLQSQWSDIMRIDRDTQRLREQAQELELEHERVRRNREAFLRRLREQEEEQHRQHRVQALAEALLEQQRQIRERAVMDQWRPPPFGDLPPQGLNYAQGLPVEEWRWVPFDRNVQDLFIRPRGG